VGWKDKFTELDKQVYRVLASSQKLLSPGEIQKSIEDGIYPGEIEDSLGFLCYTGVVSKQGRKYLVAGRLFRDWFLRRNEKKSKKKNNPKQEPGFITRLVISALVVVMIFAATIVILVWAAQQVPAVALVFIFTIAVVFDLVSIVTVLVINGTLRQKWAMDFYNTVLNRVAPMLRSSIARQAKEEQDAEANGDQE